MALLKLIILGVIQGLTEFLPVSSSGHLVLSKHILDVSSTGPLLEVALHVGTLIPILIYYRGRIVSLVKGIFVRDSESWRMAALLAVATVPAAVTYLTLKGCLDRAYQAPVVAGIALCVTGLILIIPLAARSRRRGADRLRFIDAILVGAAQAVALVPGISRSGSTIMAARHLGMRPKAAAEFSFLMAVPALVAAAALELPHALADSVATVPPAVLVVGMLTAAGVGYVALVCLIRMLNHGRFWIFGIYCLVVGAGSLLVLILT